MTDNKKNVIDVPSNSQTIDAVKHTTKKNWISEIMLKQIQGKKLSDEDWSFYMNMFVNAKDAEIEQLARLALLSCKRLVLILKTVLILNRIGS
jgi:hypothetical protein